MLEGIEEMFREYSEADEYEVSAQLELFAWRERKVKRESERRRYAFIKTVPSLREARREYVRNRRRVHGRSDEIARRRERMSMDAAYRARVLESKRQSMARARAKARAA